jgi:hypothetical protein
MTGDKTSYAIARSRAAYAARSTEPAAIAAPVASNTPRGLEATLAAISEEMTAEAIDRKRREDGQDGGVLVPHVECSAKG